MRVCFLGTPDFAVEGLKTLCADEHFEVVGVITQPDRPAGRKLQLTPSSVKQFALAQGLPVISPESLKNNPLILDEVKSWSAELAVVIAYGQILTEDFLKSFIYGCVNLHASLLPQWRGAAPIQRAIEAGDKFTGVTLQKMVKKLDAGDVLGSRKTLIQEGEDSKSLFVRLSQLGNELLHVELMDYVRGNLVPTPQDEKLVTYAKKIEKVESFILWNQSAVGIERKIRAFTMGPGCHTVLENKILKIHSSKVETHFQAPGATPGEIVDIRENSMVLATGDGFLEVFEVQPESRSRMKVKDFLKGYPLKKGFIFL